ncbi:MULTISPECIES: AEC family transporter [unclassified Caulobacter]|uniref:AEC family transporter n=1 Tax=unclassified Caulobacter TaxID=2648921 RepID=UPI0006F9C2C2|nr:MULTISPECIES: AEC family transporter [unclassified Caulobacter]KQV56254.1 transporter [Caulobacter sp. Root342]KQV70571.1 transporter [Caulobacter sp. Root343]
MTTLVLDVLSRVWPFFLLVGAGLALTRLRLLDARMTQGLSAYVYWVGFPALLIHSLSRLGRPGPELLTGLAAYTGAGLAVMAVIVAAGRLLGWNKAERAGAGMASGVGNSAFLALPITAAVLGAETARLVAGVVAIDFVVMAATGVGLLGWAAGRSVWRSTLQAFRNPVVAAALAGLALALLDLALPEPLDRAVGMAAASGSPVGLVALGAALGLRETEGEASPAAGPVVVAAVAKLIAFPLLAWLAIGLTPAPIAFRAGATLLAAAPTAVNVFIQTRAYGVFARGAARTVALTTALSLVTLAVAALLLRPLIR